MNRFRILLLLSASIVLANSLSAKLDFEHTTLALKPASGAEEIVRGEFKFTNRSAAPIKILGVNPDCGCTTADLPTKSYGPNETGVIAVKINLAALAGRSIKTVSVVTDEPADNHYLLSVDIEVIESFSISPHLLFWRPNEKPDPKKLLITLLSPDVRLLGLTAPPDSFLAELQPGATPRQATVRVTPLTLESGANGTLILEFQVGPERRIQRQVSLIILPHPKTSTDHPSEPR
jgi:hypothetical protein